MSELDNKTKKAEPSTIYGVGGNLPVLRAQFS